MKRIIKSKLLKTVLVIAVFMLTGCGQNEQQAEQQNASDIVTFQMVPSSNGVEDFIEQVFGDDYDEETMGRYYNVVPEDISNDYGFSIFKIESSGCSVLIYDNERYLLGEWVGGFGVTSFAIADLNEDGEFELYFTYSWGSGIHRSQVGYFDTASRETVIFDYSSPYSDDDKEISMEGLAKEDVSKITFSNFRGESLIEVDSNNVLCIYNADWETDCNIKSEVDIEMSAGEKLASIVADNGEIILVVESDYYR